MSYHQIIEKLQKLKALAERGEPNERESAHNKLVLLLNKYNIKPEEIENPELTERSFSYKNDIKKRILAQVIWSINSDAKIKFSKKPNFIFCYLTYPEYIEVLEKFKYYWKCYEEQSETFLIAFIYKNNLLPSNRSEIPPNPFNEKKIEDINKMMGGVTSENYISVKKRIGGKKCGYQVALKNC